jgi:DNA recombination protein RmuC
VIAERRRRSTIKRWPKIRAGIDRLAEAQAGTMGEFRGQLSSIAQAQRSMVQSTGALGAALRRPGVRGRWGEVTLQNVCEAAGLSQHIDFEVQVHLR